MKTIIGINGFGRIGRLVLRALIERKETDICVGAINDLTDPETLAHLYNFDSVHGPAAIKMTVVNGNLVLNQRTIVVSKCPNPSDIPWSNQGVTMVFECAGRFASRDAAAAHLRGTVGKVIISAPGKDVDNTVVYGVNHHSLTAAHAVISNASCTTNCLAPVALVLDKTVGIERGYMTTIHGYTADQRLVDTAHSDLRRARAGALSMIPTSTGAAKAVGLVLPKLKGKIDGCAIRVPTPNVSAIDFTFTAAQDTSIEEINDAFIAAATNDLKGVLAVNHEPLVSIDFTHRAESSIVDLDQTQVVDKRFVRVFSWYDNEWGFSNRMIDTAKAWPA